MGCFPRPSLNNAVRHTGTGNSAMLRLAINPYPRPSFNKALHQISRRPERNAFARLNTTTHRLAIKGSPKSSFNAAPQRTSHFPRQRWGAQRASN
eukprot:1627257-Alexandrium_andersonii.AAC.1